MRPVLRVGAAGRWVDFCESRSRTIGAKWPRVGIAVGDFVHNAATVERIGDGTIWASARRGAESAIVVEEV